MKLHVVDWRVTLKNILLTVAGTMILAFGTAVFILPFELVSGGVSGIAIIIERLLPEGLISVDVTVTILTWTLFLIGFLVLGRAFAAKTLISTIVYPLGTSLFMRLADPSFAGGFFCLQASSYVDVAPLLATVFGGLCVGTGCAVTFLGGGSTGGVDIIAFSLCRIFKRLKSSIAVFAVDATIIVLGMFVIGDLVISLLGIISVFISATMVDRIFLGGNRAFIAQIISENHDEINRQVIGSMNRTTTIVDAVGGYTGKSTKMIMVTFSMRQYADLMRIINKADKNAFITIQRAHEINGLGWTK